MSTGIIDNYSKGKLVIYKNRAKFRPNHKSQRK